MKLPEKFDDAAVYVLAPAYLTPEQLARVQQAVEGSVPDGVPVLLAAESGAEGIKPAGLGPVIKFVGKAIGVEVVKDVYDGVKRVVVDTYKSEQEAKEYYERRNTEYLDRADRLRG